ncbi:MAG: zinc ribbon domain-containing protein, partial [Sediminispirochaetaceae bacterium]
VYECPECGHPITIDMTSCPNCGVGLSFEIQEEGAEEESEEESEEETVEE